MSVGVGVGVGVGAEHYMKKSWVRSQKSIEIRVGKLSHETWLQLKQILHVILEILLQLVYFFLYLAYEGCHRKYMQIKYA